MKYPQSLFIQSILTRIPVGVQQIIDAPCGRGYTSSELASYFEGVAVTGVDISQEYISFAEKNFITSNLTFQQNDIQNLVEEADVFDVFCLINSLFLLPNPQNILKGISEKLKSHSRLFLVIPNAESANFSRYQKMFPKVNTFILKEKQYDDFFTSVGLQIIHKEGIARIPFFGRWDIKFLYPIRDRYLLWLEKHSKSEDYGYFLLELRPIYSKT